MNIIETLNLTYKDGKIVIRGKTMNGTLRISNGDLVKMYAGGTGLGTISVEIKNEVKPLANAN